MRTRGGPSPRSSTYSEAPFVSIVRPLAPDSTATLTSVSPSHAHRQPLPLSPRGGVARSAGLSPKRPSASQWPRQEHAATAATGGLTTFTAGPAQNAFKQYLAPLLLKARTDTASENVPEVGPGESPSKP